MRIEYINPFVEATFEVLSEILKEGNLRRGELFLKRSPTPNYGVSIIIGLTGPASGRVLLDMPPNTAKKLISAISGDEVKDLNDIGKSALGEIANMIVGNAITKLYKKGFTFALTPPTVITGNDYTIDTPQIETLVVPVIFGEDKLEINIALKEA
jgi:chemotaxis protein CheX